MTPKHSVAAGADPWAVVDVSAWELGDIETAGSSDLVWLIEPNQEPPKFWLHKNTNIPGNGGEEGQDWAEVISTQVAITLGVPCAVTRLCVQADEAGRVRRGSISLSLRESDSASALVHGGDWLEEAGIPEFRNWRERSSRGQQRRSGGGTVQRGHNLANIERSLETVKPPQGLPERLTAFDAFVGFLILDAMVANRDRHEFNWAVLRSPMADEPDRLCPSFDHGTTLGHNLTDERRLLELTRMESFAAKGTAHRFEHRGAIPSLVEVACLALARATDAGRAYWTERFARFDFDQVGLNRPIQGMSDTGVAFVRALVETNVRRMNDDFAVR
ncbi:MAG: hypothetical protein LBH76_04965 [Propionibacteriaceae bacterium]|jgi:hypothetical protein|nr:hypothetical protein [Propionibacteriaceae bacterium]